MHYYQFNIADYRKDTGHLSHEEHGIYRALIDQCYLDEQPLTLDIRSLMRKLRLTSDQKETLELILGDFFIKTDNGYENTRITAELQRLYAKSEKARASAKVRWDANAPDKDANAMRTHSERNANGMLPINPIPSNASKMLTKEIPKEINPDSWQEFLKHRKEIRKPLSELAKTKAMNAIIGLSFDDQATCIDKTIQNRWTGLFPEKSNEANKRTDKPESHHATVVKMLRTRIADGDPGAG